MLDRLKSYSNDIKTGKIKSGLEIRQATERFEKDLERTDIYFNEDKAIRAVKFIENLQHSTGKFNNLHFILEPWQLFIIGNIFGWIKKDTQVRRFSNVYIEIARKNGKTALASAISLYMLIGEGEPDAEIVLAANSREQAKIAFNATSKFGKKLDIKEKYIKSYRNEVKYSNNIVKVVASDSSKLDGLNCSCVILDEYHASKTSDVFDVLKSSQGMREQPLFITITTAGFSKKSPCYSLRITGKEILSNLKEDDTQAIFIYCLDENDKYQDSKNWIKSNPNLNITIKESFLRDEVNKAKNNISLETGVKTKNFNLWCDTITTWISSKYIMDVSEDISFDMLNEDDELFVGVDLSSNADITSVTYLWFKNEKYYFKSFYYLPEDNLNSAADREYYKIQHKKGNLILTPGNCVDYTLIMNDIITVSNKYIINKIAYDTWNSTQFVLACNENGLSMHQYIQSVANFNRPTKEFERLILKKDIVIDNNEMTRWMLSNVHLRSDSNGNVKPDKRQNAKIDGVITMLSALGIYLETPRYNITVITG